MTRHLLVLAAFVLPASALLGDEAENKSAAFVEKLDGTVGRDGRPNGPVVSIGLGYRKITDEGIKALSTLKELKWVVIHACPGVSHAAITSLQAALPDCKIDWDESS